MRKMLPLWLLLSAMGCEGPIGAGLPQGRPDAPCRCDVNSPEGCRTAYQNAQICPDISPVGFCSRYVNKSVNTDVVLFNRGLTGLRITSVTLEGDDNCAFVPPKLSFTAGEDGTIINYMRSEVIRLTYSPTKVAQDHAVLRIKSNAENFPDLNIAVCGQGLPANAPPQGADGGTCLQCNKPASTKAACGKPEGGV